jgi:hypothetical protein
MSWPNANAWWDHEAGDPVLERAYSQLVDQFALLPMPDPVYLHAARLRAHFGLRTPDALHLACPQQLQRAVDERRPVGASLAWAGSQYPEMRPSANAVSDPLIYAKASSGASAQCRRRHFAANQRLAKPAIATKVAVGFGPRAVTGR